MLVSELIEKLKTLPQDAKILVTDGSCCGCGLQEEVEVEFDADEKSAHFGCVTIDHY